MGYRSQVRCLIYGESDKVHALIAKHQLIGGKAFESFADDIEVYDIVRKIYDDEASKVAKKGGFGPLIYRDIQTTVIDLEGDSWKWYPDYPDVKAWHALMEEAHDEWELNVEFMRIGEEDDDNVHDTYVEDGGDTLLRLCRTIDCDVDDHRVEAAAKRNPPPPAPVLGIVRGA